MDLMNQTRLYFYSMFGSTSFSSESILLVRSYSGKFLSRIDYAFRIDFGMIAKLALIGAMNLLSFFFLHQKGKSVVDI